jgi:SAM-dependent methyltransferase
VTTEYTDERDVVVAAEGVYAPQEDSQLLIDVMEKTGLAIGRRVADLCAGNGVVAINAAELGASAVSAFDICPRAVRCARVNALSVGVEVDVHLGSWARAVEFAPFDLVVCNPPYVPHIRVSTMRCCQPSSDRRMHGTPDTTGDWCSIRFARPCPSCWRSAAACCWYSRNSPSRGAPLPRFPMQDWTLKLLPGNGFRSGPCCHHARRGWKKPIVSILAAARRSC